MRQTGKMAAEFNRKNPIFMLANIAEHTELNTMLTLDIKDWVIHTIAVLVLAILPRITLVAAQPHSTR
jgi:hypothetical protein